MLTQASFVRRIIFAALGAGILLSSAAFAQSSGISVPGGAENVPAAKTLPQAPVAAMPPNPHSLTGVDETAYPATLENIMKAAVKLHAYDINNDNFIDDYARISFCQVYQAHYQNEFEWKKVRVALRKQIVEDMPTYPTTFFLDRIEGFTTYDFNAGRLQMDSQSILNGVTRLRLTSTADRSACGSKLSSVIQDFIVNLNRPLDINGIKLNEQEAQTVVSGLVDDTEGQKVKRHGYGRYFITLTGIFVAPVGLNNTTLFTGNIDRITFYEDATYQKPFWSGITSEPDYQNSSEVQESIPFKGVDVPGAR